MALIFNPLDVVVCLEAIYGQVYEKIILYVGKLKGFHNERD